MKNLGKKNKMYPSAITEEKDKVSYPRVCLPLSMLASSELELGQEVELRFKGKVNRVEKSEYSEDFNVELLEGEIVTPKKEA
jgi:hypothetical protein